MQYMIRKALFKGFSLLFAISLSLNLRAQDMPSGTIFNALAVQGEHTGKINLVQDPLVFTLLQSHVEQNEKEGLIGYRIQINQWSGTNSRTKAYAKAADFINQFPDFDRDLVYIPYEAPYYKLRVGDYRSRNEAFKMYNEIKKYYPTSSFIVRTRINYPKLSSSGTE